MKTEQEQIEEMAKEMCGAINNSCVHDCTPACGAREYAKRCFEAGYRKATEVIDEFVDKVFEKIRYEYKNYPNAMTVGTYYQLRKEINELAAEMRQEVEK